MFDKLSEKYRKKMMLNVFIYYPLGLVVALSVGSAVMIFIGVDLALVPIIITAVIAIFVAKWHLSQIYKGFLEKSNPKNNP